MKVLIDSGDPGFFTTGAWANIMMVEHGSGFDDNILPEAALRHRGAKGADLMLYRHGDLS